MKVLIVTNMYPHHNPEFAYAGIFVKEQKEALERHGINCDTFIIDGFKGKIKYFSSAIKLLSHIRKNQYDVIHAHYGLSGLFTLFTPFKKKWPNVVLTLHGGDILLKQGKRIQVFLTKRIISNISQVITLNEQMNQEVCGLCSNYMTLPCGIETSFFKPNTNSKKKNLVIFPGKKTRQVKNFHFFNEVISTYRKKYEHIDYVELDGFEREDVRDLMQTAKAILMTSISEGSPQSIKEALSSDIAVVSSNVGDVQHVLGQTLGTRIFELSNDATYVADLLHSAITEADQNPGVRRARIMELKLDNDSIADSLISIYQSIQDR